ncbi:MAG: 3-dehydroquinate synthase [Chthoniobacterales bacterium]
MESSGNAAQSELTVTAGQQRYRVAVGSRLLATTGAELRGKLSGTHGAVISDANVPERYAATVRSSLERAQCETILLPIAAGEESKSLANVGEICERMAVAGLDRSSFVVALGGGVIGDLAGFVAAIYHRGIPWVNVPTTLLAMVDSSIGGKTGVNTRAGKNLIGAVHQPALVIADVDTLETLPERDFNQGFAEIIKHGIIADAKMLDKVAQVSSLRATDDATRKLSLESLIRRNIEIKASIVARDEQETRGERAVLNFGHTVGHAIERAGGYGRFLHGEAVSLGIVAACEISVRKAGLPDADRHKVVALLDRFGLPTRLPADFPRERIFEALPFDKKFEQGQVRFVVSPKIGAAHVAQDVTIEDIRAAVATL